MTNNACPGNNNSYKGNSRKQLQAHLSYHCHAGDILRELDNMENSARKNRAQTTNGGVPKLTRPALKNAWHKMRVRKAVHVTYVTGKENRKADKTRYAISYGAKESERQRW